MSHSAFLFIEPFFVKARAFLFFHKRFKKRPRRKALILIRTYSNKENPFCGASKSANCCVHNCLNKLIRRLHCTTNLEVFHLSSTVLANIRFTCIESRSINFDLENNNSDWLTTPSLLMLTTNNF